MQTFQSILLITQNPIEDLKQHYSLDCTVNHVDVLQVIPETSIGIEEIRQIQQFAVHPPIMGSQKTIVINQADKLTLEAQNALLKILEEPPSYLQIILVTTNPHGFLDTITSRCQVVRSTLKLASYDKLPPTPLLSLLIQCSPAHRLQLIPTNTKTLETAISYCDSLLTEARSAFFAQPNQINLSNFKCLHECRQRLAKNANPTIAISDCILQLAS